MIAGVSVEVGSEAVVVSSHAPLRVLSSAVHLGGFAEARAVVNLHVSKNDPCTDPAGMIAVFTATEVKGLALREAGLLADDGRAASGTSTDAVVIAATGRGPVARFGGPASEMGWVVARAVRVALERSIADWQERHR